VRVRVSAVVWGERAPRTLQVMRSSMLPICSHRGLLAICCLLLLCSSSVAADCADDESECQDLRDVTWPPAYDPTKCHPINEASSLPAKCLAPQWSLEPPCPKCWINDAPDFTPARSPTELWPALRDKMQRAFGTYLAHMKAVRPPSHIDGGTVFSGLGGRALLMLKLHAATGNSTYLARADAYSRSMIGQIGKQRMRSHLLGYVGFMLSHVGMLCIAALNADRHRDVASVEKYVKEVVEVFQAAAKSEWWGGGHDDFDSGRAGLLYAGRFLEANVKQASIPRGLVVQVAPRDYRAWGRHCR